MTPDPASPTLSVLVPPEGDGKRFDQVLARAFPQYSRSRLQRWVRDGHATVEGRVVRPRDPVREGERVELRLDAPTTGSGRVAPGWEPEPIPIEVVHEDADLLVVNKPPGLVVHPGAGNPKGTLVNALVHHDPRLLQIPRAGVVHRLDKDTSGLLVVARTLRAHARLVRALAERAVRREYLAVVVGRLTAGGRVDAPLGRHPTRRTQMAVVAGGRSALTHYRVEQRFRAHTSTRLRLESGRTHQIRVHMAYIGHPLLGDPLYGGRPRPLREAAPPLAHQLATFRRQALHATGLGLVHPETGEALSWSAPLPPDLADLLAALQADADGTDRLRDER